MKRLLLVVLTGLSLVGCSNNVDYSQTEIPVQDTKPTLEEQRQESLKRLKETDKVDLIKKDCEREDRYSLGVYSIEREKTCRKYGYKHNN